MSLLYIHKRLPHSRMEVSLNEELVQSLTLAVIRLKGTSWYFDENSSLESFHSRHLKILSSNSLMGRGVLMLEQSSVTDEVCHIHLRGESRFPSTFSACANWSLHGNAPYMYMHIRAHSGLSFGKLLSIQVTANCYCVRLNFEVSS